MLFRPDTVILTYLENTAFAIGARGGRASGRRNGSARVAAGAIAEKLIAEVGMELLLIRRQ